MSCTMVTYQSNVLRYIQGHLPVPMPKRPFLGLFWWHAHKGCRLCCAGGIGGSLAVPPFPMGTGQWAASGAPNMATHRGGEPSKAVNEEEIPEHT